MQKSFSKILPLNASIYFSIENIIKNERKFTVSLGILFSQIFERL